jgi:WD40 repeat protein
MLPKSLYSIFILVFGVQPGSLVSSSQNLTLTGHTSYVGALEFSSDHSYLASCSNDKYINTWNYSLSPWNSSTNWTLMSHTSNGGLVCSALISLPNNQLASASGNNIKVWSPLNNVSTSLTGSSNLVYGLALSPDQSILAGGSLDTKVRLWKYSTQTTAYRTFVGHTQQVRALTFVSNQMIVSGSFDSTIKTWNITSGNLYSIRLDFHSGTTC